MAVFSVERYGFVSIYNLVSSIGQDLVANGFHAAVDTLTGPLTDAEATAVLDGASIPVSAVTRPSPTYGFGVTSVSITDPGTKYDPAAPPTVTFSAPSATGRQVMLDSGYTLYTTSSTSTLWDDPAVAGTPYDVTLSSTDLAKLASAATGTAVVGADGTITGVTITNSGHGYTQDQEVTVTFSGGHLTKVGLVLESTTLVDPLGLKLDPVTGAVLADNLQVHGTGENQVAAQPWRVCFDLRGSTSPEITSGSLGIYLGTAATLRDDGVIAYTIQTPNSTTAVKVEPAGNTGKQWTGSAGTPSATSMDECFLNRAGRADPSIAAAYPMSYRLTVTDRGVFLGIWEANAEELGSGFNWLLVQRSVDRLTGDIRGGTDETRTGRCPVFCINSVNNKYYKFIVRERDLVMPSQRKQADTNVEDSSATINSKNQQSLTETGEYVITFISNLNSARYKYSDELDIIGTVSADVVGAGTAIDVTVYGESQPRTYRALYPNGAYGTGMRLMVLESNPNE